MVNFIECGVEVYDIKQNVMKMVYGVSLGHIADSKAIEKRCRKSANGSKVPYCCPYCIIKKEHINNIETDNTKCRARSLTHCWEQYQDENKFHEVSKKSGYQLPQFSVTFSKILYKFGQKKL